MNTMSALNVRDGLYIDETGHLFQVTNWLDEDGEECAREDAIVCVAGAGACWFSITISDFEGVERQ